MRYLYFVILLIFIPVLPVFAYLDPGTGSMIVSAIIGVFATIIFIFRGWFYKLFRVFKKDKSQDDSNRVEEE